MSGLAAIFHRDGRPVEPGAVTAMLAAVPYRGPDGQQQHVDGAVGLGLALHAVTPEDARERQPWVSPRTDCVIVADARLDNRDDLLHRLPVGDGPPPGDAELIMLAYETWSADAARHLLGDFAFVIWDPRGRRVVCSRDTSGQRALFYRLDRRAFAAASEIHQLFQDRSVPIRVNHAQVRESLVPVNILRNEKSTAATYFDGVAALEAGHTLVVSPEAHRSWRYWNLDAARQIRYRDPAAYAEHFRGLFSEVVRARLRSVKPMGIMLSGGIDSSSIACVAQEAYRSGTATDNGFYSYSVTYDGLDCDERDLIQEVQGKYRFPARFAPWDASDGRLIARPDGFLEAPNMGIRGMRDTMFGMAAADGVGAVLTGDVADACIYGQRFVFDSLLRSGDLLGFWRHMSAYRRVSTESLKRTVFLSCVGPLLPPTLQRRMMTEYTDRMIGRYGVRLLPKWMPDTLRHDLADRHLEMCLEAERGRRFSNPGQHEDFLSLYPPEVARHPTPWPVQIWRPFADRRLHEFMLAIPPEQRFQPHPDTDDFYAGSKWLVRRALQGILPERIRTRTKKTVFGSAHQDEIRLRWPIYEQVFGPTGHSRVAEYGYVDAARFWERLHVLREDASGPDMLYVQQIVGLETWLRTFDLPRARQTTVVPASVPARLPSQEPSLAGAWSPSVAPEPDLQRLSIRLARGN